MSPTGFISFCVRWAREVEGFHCVLLVRMGDVIVECNYIL
jgi:hypothetical protein